jgi:hypothetical protein
MSSRLETTPHRFDPMSAHITPASRQITPASPRTIPGLDRFTHHRRQPKIIAPDPQTSAHRLRTIPHRF